MDNQESRPKKSLVNLPPELIYNIASHLPNNQNLASNLWHEEPPFDVVEAQERANRSLSHVCRYLRGVMLRTLFSVTPVVFRCRPDVYDKELHTILLALEEAKRYLNSPESSIAHLVVRFLMVESPSEIQLLPDAFYQDICSRLLQKFRPEHLTVVFPSQLFPFLSSPSQREMVGQDDSWAFDMPLHVLRLSYPLTQSRPTEASIWENPWSNITLNEGSSLKAYSTYEFYSKRNPSIFLHNGFNENVISSTWSFTLREFEYVAIFPLPSHIKLVLSRLESLHNLEVLTTRFAPHENSSILSNSIRVGTGQFKDMWLGFDENYALVVDFLLLMSKHHSLKVFKPLDCVYTHVFESLHPMLEQRLQGWEFQADHHATFFKPPKVEKRIPL